MKTLLIMRHAKSSWSNGHLSDHERPLNARGLRDAPSMGLHLKQQRCIPQHIISSTAKRAATTAEMVAIACEYESDIEYYDQFYMAVPATYIAKLKLVQADHERIMVVGHNPGMEGLVKALTGVGKIFTTANIAQVELPIESWSDIALDGSGELKALWRPKEI